MCVIHRTKSRVLILITILLVLLVVIEIGGRLEDHLKDLGFINRHPTLPVLNNYQMPDPRHEGNWVLRPDFTATLAEAIEDKQMTGRHLAVEYLKTRALKLGIQPDETIFRINRRGFKGPELDGSQSRTRILTIGDSCTFGSLFDSFTYPRSLERELQRLGLNAEVINGGIEGYSIQNVRFRIEQFKTLKPEIITVYVGWNNLYGRAPLVGLAKHSYNYRILRRAISKLPLRTSPLAEVLRDSSEVRSLEGYIPPFVTELEDTIRELRSENTTVLLVTLPGLFTMDSPPSEDALKKGHLPEFTKNPYVLAKLTELYNSALRDLARRHGLGLIDLDQWSREALTPRDAYFFDSVHLYEEGQEMIGKFIASEIMQLH